MAFKILAVDDEPSIVRLVSSTLTNRGYEVITAHNGEEAVDKTKLEKPDLIVLDVMMPRMDGREVRRQLAADPKTKDIPIIFLSAIGDLASQLETMEESTGEVDYMTKPFKPSELADYVDAILKSPSHEELARHRRQNLGKLRTMVEIMHRQRP